jgi:Predicted permease
LRKIKIDWNYWIIRFLFLMAVIIGFKLLSNYQYFLTWFHRLVKVLSPFIIGFIIAYLLNGPQLRIERLFEKFAPTFLKKRKRGLSVLLLYAIIIWLVFVALNYVIPLIIKNIIDLIALLPTFYNYLLDVVDKLDKQGTFEFLPLDQIVNKVTADYSPEQLLTQWSQALSSIGALTKEVSSFVLNFFLSVIISIYTLLFKDAILNFAALAFQKVFSQELFFKTKRWIKATNKIFYKFIGSQFIDACIICVASMILLSVMHVKFAVTLALLLGVCNMIPYFGAIFASVITGIICFFTGGLSHAIYVMVALIVLQQIDGNIIGPRIMSGALNLNPIVIIISITVGGAYFGVLGMFLAVPIAAILKIIVTNWLEAKQTT